MRKRARLLYDIATGRPVPLPPRAVASALYQLATNRPVPGVVWGTTCRRCRVFMWSTVPRDVCYVCRAA